MGSPVPDYRAVFLRSTFPLGCWCLPQEGCTPPIFKCEPGAADCRETLNPN